MGATSSARLESATSAQSRYDIARAAEGVGDLSGAVETYKHVLGLDPDFVPARRRLARILLQLGRRVEALPLCRSELESGTAGEEWITRLIVRAMEGQDLTMAGHAAWILAVLQRGSEWWPALPGVDPPAATEAELTLPKLRHDENQLRYLQETGVFGGEVDDVLAGYAATRARLAGIGDNRKVPLEPEDRARIGRAYGRILHLADAPRLDAALSPSWDRADVQRRYRSGPGVVVVDDFLTPEALQSVYRFCLESTVWSKNRYADGRLGALFFGGFNAPLLLQIAEEVRDALADVIGGRHPLRQLWGFKNTGTLPAGSTIHADFAAVNVNLWVTPTEANLDPGSGGLLVYDVDAPLSWDFATYNERLDVIRQFLSERRARVIRIPYRQNRAIIFNSDLFHATEAVSFRPDYRGHRINVTMLYGERADDEHHAAGRAGAPAAPGSQPWRSGAFRRSRR